MKFIFPQNYRFSNKLFGIFDYSTAILNVVIGVIVFSIANLLFKDISSKIFFMIIFCFPIFLFSIFGFQHEPPIYVLLYILKFTKSRKIYLYRK